LKFFSINTFSDQQGVNFGQEGAATFDFVQWLQHRLLNSHTLASNDWCVANDLSQYKVG